MPSVSQLWKRRFLLEHLIDFSRAETGSSLDRRDPGQRGSGQTPHREVPLKAGEGSEKLLLSREN